MICAAWFGRRAACCASLSVSLQRHGQKTSQVFVAGPKVATIFILLWPLADMRSAYDKRRVSEV